MIKKEHNPVQNSGSQGDPVSNGTGKSVNAEREEKVLDFWRENTIFEQSLAKDSPKGEFVFYEGPPTANGKPGIHHLEARSFKDAIPRYKTMQGFHVRRKGGWDTHGLPVELQVEKALGLKSKKEIESYGIAEFNKKCKESVWEYRDIWQKFTTRMGFWVDQKNPYVTYHNSYIESVWNVVKTVHEKNLLYKDYKVVPWCPRCGTALSSHELAQGYQDDKDLSVTAKFKVIGQENTYLLAWTTTPWTLPGNVGLAVGEDIEYSKWEIHEVGSSDKQNVILATNRASTVLDVELIELNGQINGHVVSSKSGKDIEYTLISKMQGKDLVGWEYEPLYPFLKDNLPESQQANLKNAFKVYPADFVTTTDGTGIVHTAVMYGQEDFDLGTKVGLPKYHLVKEDGTFKDEAGFLAGRFVKDEEVAIDIIKDLAHRGLLFKKEKYEHSYPHCWRCKTPLIYFARDSWYIEMSSLRNTLMKENESINWEPSHIKEGRFGEWLREVKDWAISRERYWGTPLPIWANKDGKIKLIGSIDELKKYTKKSGNNYFVMRHGEAQHNLGGLISEVADAPDHLTEKGKEQVRESALAMKDSKIDLIIASPFLRTEETTEIVRETLDLPKSAVVIDDRLHEMKLGKSGFKTWAEYHDKLPKVVENFSFSYPQGESYEDVKKRIGQFIYEMEEKYKGKNILIVTHGGPAWLLSAVCHGYDAEESLNMIRDKKDFHYLDNAEVSQCYFVTLPHNEKYELDLHKPYIDNVKLVNEDGEELARVKEVMDVWLDSGTMPFSQDHYPFENKDWVYGPGYPADYICEAIDQTRGWFYTLHAVGVLMGRGKAYKNVICLGHILDAKGKKMSKSQGNIVDPWEMIEKYGVDALRMWMYSVNQPGDSKNFDEKTVAELNSKVFALLYNVLSFYELYRDKEIEQQEIQSDHVLDVWIMARLNQLIELSTRNLDAYKLFEPTRAIREFMDDLSTWYLRRSRDRLKDEDRYAKATLYTVLKTLVKVMAPFAPFAAEDVWQKLKNENDEMSVHLTAWPESQKINEEVLQEMETVRKIVTLGFEARQKAGVKVRQPLQELAVKKYELKDEYTEILKDELNVKQIARIDTIEGEVELDTEISAELKLEGDFRELMRAIQDMRKQMDLVPSDRIAVTLSGDGEKLVSPFMDEFKKTVGAEKVDFGDNDGAEITMDAYTFRVKIEK